MDLAAGKDRSPVFLSSDRIIEIFSHRPNAGSVFPLILSLELV
jgi:hypothetical protein